MARSKTKKVDLHAVPDAPVDLTAVPDDLVEVRTGSDNSYDLVFPNTTIRFINGVARVDQATATMLRTKGYVK